MILRPATDDDWHAIRSLLEAAGLPPDGARSHLGDFVVAVDGTRLAAAAGIERHGRHGLLRSVVVDDGYRGQGLGRRLVEHLMHEAPRRNLDALYLLTTTAAAFFERLGFAVAARTTAPAALHASAEFQGACPASATFMRRNVG